MLVSGKALEYPLLLVGGKALEYPLLLVSGKTLEFRSVSQSRVAQGRTFRR